MAIRDHCFLYLCQIQANTELTVPLTDGHDWGEPRRGVFTDLLDNSLLLQLLQLLDDVSSHSACQ